MVSAAAADTEKTRAMNTATILLTDMGVSPFPRLANGVEKTDQRDFPKDLFYSMS